MAEYLFPFFNDEIEEYIQQNVIDSDLSTFDKVYTDIEWDYSNNTPVVRDGDFVIAVGINAVKSWAYRTLRTERYRFEIFTWNYGLDLESFVGKVLTDKNRIDLTKEIRECLLQNKHIENVINFEFETDKNKVIINFQIITKYGNLNEGVELDAKY